MKKCEYCDKIIPIDYRDTMREEYSEIISDLNAIRRFNEATFVDVLSAIETMVKYIRQK